tara:strand:- start:15068 stop:15643 length:576 start_codon:yes stop_codon:yes gene_type:complete
MKITRRQLRRIIKEASASYGERLYRDIVGHEFQPDYVYRPVQQMMGQAQPQNLIKYRSVNEVMKAIANYYRKKYGPDDAKAYIRANPTIIDFLENDSEALKSMHPRRFGGDSFGRPGILYYSPSEISLSWGNVDAVAEAGQDFQRLPGDLAQIAEQLYNEDRLLPAFLHLITGTQPRNHVNRANGYGSISN